MSLVNSILFFLTVVMGIHRFPANDTNRAIEVVGEVAYKELKLDDYVKKLEKKYVPEQFRLYGGFTIIAIEIATTQRIRVEWTF